MYATNKKQILDYIVNKQCNDGQSHRQMSHQTTFQLASMKN